MFYIIIKIIFFKFFKKLFLDNKKILAQDKIRARKLILNRVYMMAVNILD